MSEATIATDLPNAVIVNAVGSIAVELEKNLSEFNLPTVRLKSDGFNNFAKSHDVGYVAWFTGSVDEHKTFKEILNSHRSVPAKWILISSFDQIFVDAQQVSNNQNLLIQFWDDILQTAHASGQDIRIIGVPGIGGGNTVVSSIKKQLKEGYIKKISQSMFSIPHPVSLAQTICSIWFDRGHRQKTVIVNTLQSLSVPQVADALRLEIKNLNIKNDAMGEWGNGKNFQNFELVQIPSWEPAEFIKELKLSFLPVTTVAPLARPTPFRAEIIEEPGSAPITPATSPREVIRPPAPKEEVVVKAKALLQDKPKNRFRWRWLAAFMAFVFLAGGLVVYRLQPLLSLSLQSSNEHVSTAGPIASVMVRSLETFPSGEQGLMVSVKNQLLKYLRHKELVAMKVKADYQYAEGVRRMMVADQEDPYEPLRLARLGYDSIYVYQTTYQISLMENEALRARRHMLTLLPQIIPAYKKTTMLVLLQNNLELRPTGGFIGAVLILTFDHGKLINQDIRNIYDLDSNLKGLVTPPPELTSYLGESNWYFRDSNWSPDFRRSAAQASWFLEKEWGSKADVVVGVNGNTFKNILAATGPITLAGGQVIGADNIFVSAFNHQDTPSVKPESGRQEFFSLLVKPIMDRLSQPSSDSGNPVLAALEQSASSGDLTFMTPDSQVGSVVEDSGWGGTLDLPPCPAEALDNCLQDLISVNDANIGINKANFYVTRSIDHTLRVKPQSVEHTHSVTYANASPSDQWPGGSYKTFTRIRLPLAAQSISVSIDNEVVPGENLVVTHEGGHTQIALSLEVKPQARKTLSTVYTLPKDSEKILVWSLVKQPGQPEDEVGVTVIREDGGGLVSSNLPEGKNRMSFAGKMSKNAVVTIELPQ